jgi:hypothetical protein
VGPCRRSQAQGAAKRQRKEGARCRYRAVCKYLFSTLKLHFIHYHDDIVRAVLTQRTNAILRVEICTFTDQNPNDLNFAKVIGLKLQIWFFTRFAGLLQIARSRTHTQPAHHRESPILFQES